MSFTSDAERRMRRSIASTTAAHCLRFINEVDGVSLTYSLGCCEHDIEVPFLAVGHQPARSREQYGCCEGAQGEHSRLRHGHGESVELVVPAGFEMADLRGRIGGAEEVPERRAGLPAQAPGDELDVGGGGRHDGGGDQRTAAAVD